MHPHKPGPGTLAELTFKSTLLGILVGILFGAANAYLGLRVGLTVSASIPAAVMSITIFRALQRLRLSRPATILENNMVQTIGSAGESLAAGVIFTVPALILLGFDPGLLKIFIFGCIGGVLGVLFMIPLRRFLIVQEHANLLFPEGTACAAVLDAGEAGGSQGKLVMGGLGLGAVYELLVSGSELWKATPRFTPRFYPGAEVSADASPALLGVGYVVGPRIAAIMFGGGAIAWLALIPTIKFFGGFSPTPIFPASLPIAELDPHGIWTNYIRYIGAGAVVFGGFITLIRSLPAIVASGRAAVAGLRAGKSGPAPERTEHDLPGPIILAGILLIAVAMLVLPRSVVPGDALTVALALLFSFFFVAVSSRIVGLVGSSSNPISGMTIAALLATSLAFKLLGLADGGLQAAALAVGAIVCIGAAIAGDISQDLKTGWLVGATPWRQQVGQIVGVITSAAVIGFVVLRLHKAYGFGSETLPAPQATLMSMVVKGVFAGDLPWGLVLIGIAIAAVVELLGIPSLPFAVGLYLPFSLSATVFAGGMIRALVERRAARRRAAAAGESAAAERGVLFSSGLIAGSAFVGMAVGLLRSIGKSPAVTECLAASGFRGCLFRLPGGTLAELCRQGPERLLVGPEWAGRHQDAVAGLIILGLCTLLYFIARAPEPKTGAE